MTQQLDVQMAALLAKMSVLSEVAAARTGDIVHGGEHSQAPKGPKAGMVDEFRRLYATARTDTRRRAVIDEAEMTLRRHRFSPRSMVKGTLEWTLAIAHDPRPAKDVAYVFGCTERHVYRVRAMTRSGSVAA